MEKDKLRECPFCGDIPEGKYLSTRIGPGVKCWNIDCVIYGVMIPISKWNTRQSPSEGLKVILGPDQVVDFKFMGYTAKELIDIIYAYKSATHPAKGLDKKVLTEFIDNNNYSTCSRCEGSGLLYADGKAHYHSENAKTINCIDCSGTGKTISSSSELAKDICTKFSRPEVPTVSKEVLKELREAINYFGIKSEQYLPHAESKPFYENKKIALQAIHDLLKIGVEK